MRILSSLRKGGDRSAHACFFTKNCQETEDKLLFCRPSSRSSVWRRCAAHPLKSSRWGEIVFSFSYILRQLLNSRQTTFDGQLGRFGSQVGQKWAWKKLEIEPQSWSPKVYVTRSHLLTAGHFTGAGPELEDPCHEAETAQRGDQLWQKIRQRELCQTHIA